MTKLIIIYILCSSIATYSSINGIMNGCKEINPLMPSSVRNQLLVRSGATVGIAFSLNILNKRDKKLYKILGLSEITINTLDAIHNFKQNCK